MQHIVVTSALIVVETIRRVAAGRIAGVDANVRVVEENAARRSDFYLQSIIRQESTATSLNTSGSPPVDITNTVHVIVSLWAKETLRLFFLHRESVNAKTRDNLHELIKNS